MRVLVAEDSSAIRVAVRDGLAEHGFEVDVASNGEDALWLALHNTYDLVVLDLKLPLVEGLVVLRELRSKGFKVPILVVTALDTVEDRVTGLDAGADDYLVKPFAFAELLARVRMLIRTRNVAKDIQLQVDDLVIDTSKRRVRRGDAEIAVSPREYSLLEYLAMHAGKLVTRNDIWEHVYDFRSEAHSNVVDVYISYLRKKLGMPSLIHTRRGQGYVLGSSS